MIISSEHWDTEGKLPLLSPPPLFLCLSERHAKKKKTLQSQTINDPLTLFIICRLGATLAQTHTHCRDRVTFQNCCCVTRTDADREEEKSFPGCWPETGKQENMELEVVQGVFLACWLAYKSHQHDNRASN